MTESQPYLDIVVFAMIAVFLGLRLRSVLGRRNAEQDQPPRPANPEAAVIELEPRRVAREKPADPLAQIGAADPSFNTENFLSGAQWAFEMIVKSFAAGDKAALKPLLSDSVYADFSQVIDQRALHPDEHPMEFLRIVSATFADAKLEGRVADIAVRFVSEQKSAEGEEVRMIDLWRFARDVSSKDPNWRLVATGAADH